MPELPEVETFARALREGRNLDPGAGGHPGLPGQRIVGFRCDHPRCVPQGIAWMRRAVSGALIREVGRRGKYIAISLQDGCILIHLKMSGRLSVVPGQAPRGPHLHCAFPLESGYELRLDDARKFGRVRMVSSLDVLDAELGIEPLGRGFTAARLGSLLAATRMRLKAFLLDQGRVAGIGNIYADEALWLARLHPARPAASLSPRETDALRRAIRFVLLRGIRRNGASIDWVYPGGSVQEDFKAYGRTGLPCPRCGKPIRRILIAQRASHFCPACQRAPRGGRDLCRLPVRATFNSAAPPRRTARRYSS